ncbi:PDZ domain-containing protein [candidate division KSB1 bacterium]|nr:PDZ domain-containing protein [candidate division KSB1 bacterium]
MNHFFFIVGLILILTSGLNAHSSKTLTKITYLLSIDENYWRSYRISIIIEKGSTASFIFTMPAMRPENQLENNGGIRVFNFKAQGESNFVLEYEKIAHHRWLVKGNGHAILRITYDVEVDPASVIGQRLSPRGTLINSQAVFMGVEGYEDLPLTLRVQVPLNWKIITSLQPSTAIDEYAAENYFNLIDSPIQMGDLQDFYFTIANQTVNITINPSRSFNIDRFLSTIRRIVATETYLFKEVPFDNYYFMVEIYDNLENERASGHFGASTLELPGKKLAHEINFFAPLVAREFFKRWNGCQFRSGNLKKGLSSTDLTTATSWFTEGLSDYYSELVLVRSNIWSSELFYSKISERIARLEENPWQNKVSIQAISSANPQASDEIAKFHHDKGYLLILFLDFQIRKVTHNQQSLDDVVRFFNWWFGKNNQLFVAEDILRAINSVGQHDFSEFFNRYVLGTQSLPYSALFDSAGYQINISSGWVADLGNLDELNRQNTVTSLSKESPFTNYGIMIGDRIVRIDTVKIQSKSELSNYIEKKLPETSLTFELIRNQKPLSIAVKTGKKGKVKCQIISKSILNQFQQQLQQEWLKSTPNWFVPSKRNR